MQTNPPLAAGLFMNSAQMMMRSYWMAAHRNPWISSSERLISGKLAGVEWHLEEGGNEIDATSSPLAQATLQLLEKPQENLQIGRKLTRRELWNQTSRYMGLTGNAFWLMDEKNMLGLPNSLLWIRPDRMTPAEDAKGNLTGWVLDAQQGAYINGAKLQGIPLELDSLLHFILIPPDEGHFGMGLVEAAVRKLQLTELADSYAAGTLASGGRLSGLITGTQQSPIPDEVFKQLVRDLRAVTEQPDNARRVTVLQGDVNWKQTGMTPLDIGLIDIMKLSRDDTFGIWQAPFSLVYGGQMATGLNSGESRKYDEAALWQGPVDDRLVVFREVLQFQLLDRLPQPIELVIEEPEFDDDSPRYDLLMKSQFTPMRSKERRELIGLDPFGDPTLDDAVWLPATMVEAFTAPPDEQAPSSTEVALGRVPAAQLTSGQEGAAAAAGETSLGKASRTTGLQRSLTALRSRLQASQTPRIREAVGAFLSRQRSEIAKRIRSHSGHTEDMSKDTDPWWDGKKWDAALKKALTPYLAAVADNVSAHIATTLEPKAKADPVVRVLTRGAARVTRINDTTRDAVASVLATGIEQGLTLNDIADAIEGLGDSSLDISAFDDYRAELIARTELMDAYNGAALGSYGEAGITQVQAIDGDGDEECAARDGEIFDIDEADTIEDHPNGTLDWVPVMEEVQVEAKATPITTVQPIELPEPPAPRLAQAMELYLAERDAKATVTDDRLAALAEQFAALARDALAPRDPPQITVRMPELPTPTVNVKVDSSIVPAPAVTVNLPEPSKRVVKTVVRGADKQIVGSIEERD